MAPRRRFLGAARDHSSRDKPLILYISLTYNKNSLTLPYLVLPCLTLPCLVLSCLALPFLILSCLVLPCLALPYLVLSCHVLPLTCLTFPYLILPYLILPCVALSSPAMSGLRLALPCFVLSCLALSCLILYCYLSLSCIVILFLRWVPAVCLTIHNIAVEAKNDCSDSLVELLIMIIHASLRPLKLQYSHGLRYCV
jgi:hypothetical protein